MQPPRAPEHVRALQPYVPGRPVEEVEREYGLVDVIKLASNENPLGPSPRAIAAIRAAAGQVGEYPDASCHRLVKALARHWKVQPEQLIVGNGSDEVIHLLGVAYVRPGDQVLTGRPSFVRYEAVARLNEAELVEVPLREHRFDLAGIAERLGPRTRLVFIANPNNPTGTIVRRRELDKFLGAVPEDAMVVLDEAYFEYVEDPDYPDGLEHLRAGRNVVVLRTFSKIYALAGLRVGYGIAHPEVIEVLHRVREPFNVNRIAQEAALASLDDATQVERARTANSQGRQQLLSGFAALGLECVPTHANFVLVHVRRAAQEVFQALLRRGVIVRPGEIFGLPTHLRVTIGTANQNERFLKELRLVLDAEPASRATASSLTGT